MTEHGESAPGEGSRAESVVADRRGDLAPVEAGNDRRGRLEQGARAALLSLFFPGCGQLYAGRTASAILWALLFAAVVMPLALFGYVVWASFESRALGRIAFIVAILQAACAAGAFLAAWRGASGPAGMRRKASVGVLGLHAAVLTFVVGLETVWFLQTFLGSRRVETAALEPRIARGEDVTVAFSKYVRPFHGDIVLCEPAGSSGDMLARVLAKPGDRIESRGGKLLVNGIEVDLLRRDQRRELEKAGRRERMWRILPGRPPPPVELEHGHPAELGGADWGPFIVPGATLLVIPDAPGGSSPGGTFRAGVLIPESSLRGRVIGS